MGEKGIEKIFQVSKELHGAKAKGREILRDTTVQEKNITYPTDTNAHLEPMQVLQQLIICYPTIHDTLAVFQVQTSTL